MEGLDNMDFHCPWISIHSMDHLVSHSVLPQPKPATTKKCKSCNGSYREAIVLSLYSA